ncbi:GntR family transcriptional regulator [Hahella aquimaris]|uniref:GntR family transcriptional regulator n=1 Tax=Hahella sp. HNIBRBA332 TaxID=3015983 RepID=UPI00273B90CD|nr:GntR family transcriptional regulator [Hahella sp. HNIBRBA332]WLQ16875.1 GntR family transcriptional regulator [Hahella sp. HNIBRBA332]
MAAPDSRTLADQAFERLQTAIVKGDIRAGEKISEAELSSKFGFGRGPLREALHRLEGRGLIVRKAHSGARVVALTFEELIELYEVRESLEGMAIRLASERMSQEEIDDLKRLMDIHAEQIKEEKGLAYYQKEGDFDFHFRIISGSKNRKLSNMLTGELYHLLRLYRYRLSTFSGRPEKAFHEHWRIIEALEERDGDLAELLMRRHISAARNNLIRKYRDGELQL